jgi:hypothetical protein
MTLRRWTLLALLLVLPACGAQPEPRDLARFDPEGAEACALLGHWLRSDRVTPEFEVTKEAARHASAARTKSIRDTANGVADIPRSGGPNAGFDGVAIADLRKLHAACEAAGVDLPPYRD